MNSTLLSEQDVKKIISALLIRIYNDRQIYKDESKNQLECAACGDQEPLNVCYSKFFGMTITVIQVLEALGMITVDNELKGHLTEKFKLLLLKEDELTKFF